MAEIQQEQLHSSDVITAAQRLAKKVWICWFDLGEKCTCREQAAPPRGECLGFPQILLNWEVLAESSGEGGGGGDGRGSRKGRNIDSRMEEEVLCQPLNIEQAPFWEPWL